MGKSTINGPFSNCIYRYWPIPKYGWLWNFVKHSFLLCFLRVAHLKLICLDVCFCNVLALQLFEPLFDYDTSMYQNWVHWIFNERQDDEILVGSHWKEIDDEASLWLLHQHLNAYPTAEAGSAEWSHGWLQVFNTSIEFPADFFWRLSEGSRKSPIPFLCD